MDKIKNFEELIRDHIGPNKTVIETKLENLTAPGENYMSEIVKIIVTLKNNDTGDKEDLHVVAKLVTADPMFGTTANLNKSEIIFYTKIIPAIKWFHEKYGLPEPTFYPKLIGARINLTGSDIPDMDAVLILENLKEQGYENIDRHVGYDLESAKLVLKDLATFHAVPLAMKLLEPEIFENVIKANYEPPPPPQPAQLSNKPSNRLPSDSSSGDPAATTVIPFLGPFAGPPGGLPGSPPYFKFIYEILKQQKGAFTANRFRQYTDKIDKYMRDDPSKFFEPDPVEPFATLVHMDIWINNTMQRIENGISINNKLLDFQMFKIASPALDLIFLLFSSVELSCLKNNLDLLIEHYYQMFTNVLKKCGCYDTQFSYDNFLKELKVGAERGIEKNLIMLPNVVFVNKGEVGGVQKILTIKKEEMHPLATEKLIFLCFEAAKRNWF